MDESLASIEDLLQVASPRQAEAIRLWASQGSYTGAARAMGVSEVSVRKLIGRARKKLLSEAGKKQVGKPPQEYEQIEAVQNQDGCTLNIKSLSRIQSAEDAMQRAGLDPAIYKIVKAVGGSYEACIKVGPPGKEHEKVVPLWKIEVTCKRLVDESIERSADVLAKRVFNRKLSWPKVHLSTPAEDPSKLVIGLVDQHLAKLCWAPETRSNFDLNIATDLFSRAVRYSCQRTKNCDIEEIVLPIGNDYCHIDTRQGTTEKGTQLDFDSRYEKMAGVAEEAAIMAVETARQNALVRVIWVGGNHDPVTSMWICRCIHHAFRGTNQVTVDTTPSPHKYLKFGKCLLGFAHGDAPKEKQLKDIMPVEEADAWAKAKECREWLTGHLHQQKKTERIGTHEEAGQVFRILPSLCGTDSWHYRNGFSMSRKATESYLYSHEFGFSQSIQASARRLLETA